MAAGPIGQTLARLFESNGWDVEPLEDEPGYLLQVQGDSGTWNCVAVAEDELGYFAFYSVAPMEVPDLRRPAVAEFVCRANLGMLTGNFELDMDEGTVRYKTSIDLSPLVDQDLGPSALATDSLGALLEDLIVTNLATFDRYALGLVQVAMKGKGPADAVARAEARIPDNGSTAD